MRERRLLFSMLGVTLSFTSGCMGTELNEDGLATEDLRGCESVNAKHTATGTIDYVAQGTRSGSCAKTLVVDVQDLAEYNAIDVGLGEPIRREDPCINLTLIADLYVREGNAYVLADQQLIEGGAFSNRTCTFTPAHFEGLTAGADYRIAARMIPAGRDIHIQTVPYEPPPNPERPPVLCESPLAPANVSQPTTVVGNGSSASCTEAALAAAVAQGGVITFNCGPGSTTIAITQTLVAPTDRDTTIDGGDKIVLDGGGTTQILRSFREDFRANDRVLTVQRLTMRNGRDVGSDFVPRNGELTCAWGYKSGGGGAIFTRDMNIHAWGVIFENNHGPEIGPDVAGGAIYSVGSKHVRVANSIFRGNTASNGGALGLLHSAAELYNVILENNEATGILANFANATGCPYFNHEEQGGAGGLGGAFYSDGFDPGDTFCGVRLSDNSSGDLGGAVFRSAYWGLIPDVARQEITWDKTTFERNHARSGGGGGAYVNNSLFTVRNSRFEGNIADGGTGGGVMITGATVAFSNNDFVNNTSAWGGGIAHWGVGADGNAGTSSDMRYSGNTPNDVVGDFPL